MAKKNSRALELTIISAEALSLTGKRPVKKNAFVVIKVDSNDDQATTMDAENGSYPSWNDKFFINMPMHAKFFTLEGRCKNFSGDHLVGSARVPTSDFVGRYFPSNYLHFLSYRLRDRYGERNGIINLSIKMKTSSDGASTSNYSSSVTGWNDKVNIGQRVSHGVVIGVPVQHNMIAK